MRSGGWADILDRFGDLGFVMSVLLTFDQHWARLRNDYLM